VAPPKSPLLDNQGPSETTKLEFSTGGPSRKASQETNDDSADIPALKLYRNGSAGLSFRRGIGLAVVDDTGIDPGQLQELLRR
jgi:hypothetical protein